MAGAAIEIKDERHFDKDVIKSPIPVLVDFWAPWCGPCRMIAPHVEKLAQTWAGRTRVVKVNCDQNQRIQRLYNVMGIPALILFKNGEPVDRLVGAHPVPEIERMIARHAPAEPVADPDGVGNPESNSETTTSEPAQASGYYDRFITRRRRR